MKLTKRQLKNIIREAVNLQKRNELIDIVDQIIDADPEYARTGHPMGLVTLLEILSDDYNISNDRDVSVVVAYYNTLPGAY